VTLVRQRNDLGLVPPAALRLSLDVAQAGAATAGKPQGSGQQISASQKRAGARSQAAPSWWTARARDAEVKPGFSKAEILKPKHEDPRAAGGIFERVGRLLSELLDQR
jgi:hypothetical protein